MSDNPPFDAALKEFGQVSAELHQANAVGDHTDFSAGLQRTIGALELLVISGQLAATINGSHPPTVICDTPIPAVKSLDYSDYDAGTDVGDKFSEEFKKYVREEKLLCQKWMQVSDISTTMFNCLWVFRTEQQVGTVDSTYNDLIDKITSSLEHDEIFSPWLVQFWAAQELDSVDGRRFRLTTRDQPFLISEVLFEEGMIGPPFNTGLSSYRVKMVDIVSGDRGVISRVFRYQRMEFSPDIGDYSYVEYPHLDLSLSCDIKCSLALPLSDRSGHLLGVIELVSPGGPSLRFTRDIVPQPEYYIKELCRTLQRKGLDHCKSLCGQLATFFIFKYALEDNSIHSAISEVREVIKVVGKTCDLVFCQTWMLCKLCNSICTCEGFGYLNASYSFYRKKKFFLEAESMCFLQEGEGIVGKAASSPHHMIYSEDVAKFSIIEYPLAHFVRIYGLSACFAICVRSFLTGDQVYILEFFIRPVHVKGRDLRKKLIRILEVMRRKFRTFKLASGGEIGDSLSLHVIDVDCPDKIVSLENKNLNLNFSIVDKNFVSGEPSVEENYTDENDDPIIRIETSSQDTIMQEAPVASASTVQSEMQVTIQASYGSDSCTFRLHPSSGIHELDQKVSKKLKMEVGTYLIKYKDEDDDSIIITCDEDLHCYISSEERKLNERKRKRGKMTLLMSVEPKP